MWHQGSLSHCDQHCEQEIQLRRIFGNLSLKGSFFRIFQLHYTFVRLTKLTDQHSWFDTRDTLVYLQTTFMFLTFYTAKSGQCENQPPIRGSKPYILQRLNITQTKYLVTA